MAWHGMAWHGMAWHGMAWHGVAWHGMSRDAIVLIVLMTRMLIARHAAVVACRVSRAINRAHMHKVEHEYSLKFIR